MSDYSNGKIYKIVCHETHEVYYGSTTSTLGIRLSQHKCKSKCKSKQIMDRGNYSIILVKDFPCESRKELEREEGIYIRNNECINKMVAGRTHEEYREENKDKKCEYDKVYREENKDVILTRKKQYYINNRGNWMDIVICECGASMVKSSLNRHKKRKKHLQYLQTHN